MKRRHGNQVKFICYIKTESYVCTRFVHSGEVLNTVSIKIQNPVRFIIIFKINILDFKFVPF